MLTGPTRTALVAQLDQLSAACDDLDPVAAIDVLLEVRRIHPEIGTRLLTIVAAGVVEHLTAGHDEGCLETGPPQEQRAGES